MGIFLYSGIVYILIPTVNVMLKFFFYSLADLPRLLCNCGIQSKGVPDTDIKVSVYI